MKLSKKIFPVFMAIFIWLSNTVAVCAQPQISSPSAILMESSTGKIIYERNATDRCSPASITKIMTLLLTFEAIETGRVSLQDQVLTSEYASSMGGSQVYLAQGEVQTLDTMIKCIAVASGNDASVAVAEHVAGSEQAFVEKMNEKAVSLGMLNTHFMDCCGLSDSDEHYTCARDVAIMSRELTVNYPQVFEYTQIWMEDIIHETKQGSNKFTLSSTNKLLKQYQYATGLKTGSTSKAKFCLSATASKDGIDLIAVIMGAPDKNTRLSEAQTLLTYGFGVCRLYTDKNQDELGTVIMEKGVKDEAHIGYGSEFRYLDVEGNDLSGIEKIIDYPERVKAPVKEGEQVGVARYLLSGKELGTVPIIFTETVERANYFDCLLKVFSKFLL